MKTTFARKPAKCPKCGSPKIAVYQYGMPAYSADVERRIREGKVVLGGCVISIDGTMPRWVCTGCGTDFFKLVEAGKMG